MSTSDVDGVCEEFEGCKLDVEKKISDEELFKQPPPKEDCPICFIQLPLLKTGYRYMTCCGKVICCGCIHAPVYDHQGNEVDNNKCPFCRIPYPESGEEMIERQKKRVEKDDPIATYNKGNWHFNGKYGVTRDYTKALELFHRAAELGHAGAYLGIGNAYFKGKGVEVDKEKAKQYYDIAAMRGNATARYNLGLNEARTGNWDRAIKHFMVAVRGGDSIFLDEIKQLYSNGHATKEDYTKALRLYQEYLGEIKSKQRDKAAAFSDEYRYY